MSPRSTRRWLVGGLGEPHDSLVAGVFRQEGYSTSTIGPLDADAYARGQSALPRGQCAPLLYTTGALLRSAEASGVQRLGWVSPRTCGPCRYSAFESAWARALKRAGRTDVEIISVDQSIESLRGLLSPEGAWRVLDALLVADVLREMVNRLRPHVVDATELETAAEGMRRRIADASAGGVAPIESLRREASALRGLERKPARPLGRAMLVGDPWSLHVEGDGQLNLGRALADAGMEIEQPPFALWIDYLAWQRRSAPFGAAPTPGLAEVTAAQDLSMLLHERLAQAAVAAGLGGVALPSQDELEELAVPHLSPELRGGYGHVEVALAVRAARDRRAHVVFSVKSFGCSPSSGISDAIVPRALCNQLPFLAVEVSGDGEAARESRLTLRVATALEQARREFQEACMISKRDPATVWNPDPFIGRFEAGTRPFACTLACAALGGES